MKIECSYGSEYTPEHDREKCLTLLYGPKSEKVDAIMKILAELNGLTMGEDIEGACGQLRRTITRMNVGAFGRRRGLTP